jgi:hypothetical protein
MLEALRDNGVGYVLFALAGGVEQLRQFARDIMPGFATPRAHAAE